VAQIGATKYESLAEAVAAAKIGETVELLKSLASDDAFTFAKDVSIDGNGYTLGNKVVATGEGVVVTLVDVQVKPVDDYSVALQAQKGAQIVVNAGSVAEVVYTGSVAVDATSKVTLTAGDFRSTAFAVTEGGQLVISGGTYDADPKDYLSEYSQAEESAGIWTVSAKEGDSGIVVEEKTQETEEKTIKIPQSWLAEKGVKSADDAKSNGVNSTGDNGIKVWQSYVLGLDPNDKASVPAAKPQQLTIKEEKDLGQKIKVVIDNVVVPEAVKDQVERIRYQLLGATAKDAEEWTVVDEKDDSTELAIPMDTQYRYFTTKAIITIK